MKLIDNELMKLIEDVQIGTWDCETAKRRFTKKYKEPAEYKEFNCKTKKIEVVDNKSISPQPIPGAKVEIYWKQFKDPDYGYIFTLPGDDEEDIFISGIIHIPFPQGGEKCQDPPEWIFIGRLISYPEVTKVKIIA